MRFRFAATISLSLAFLGALQAGPVVSLDLSVLGQSAYASRTIASALSFPYGLAATTNGSILYGQSVPQQPFGIEGGPSAGSVWMSSKMADGSFGAPQQVIGNLAGPVTDVRTTSTGMILVDSGGASQRTMSFYDSNFQLKGTVSFDYPNQGWWHSAGMSIVAPQGGGVDRIYFIVGSEGDNFKTSSTVSTSGLFSSTLQGDSIYSVDVTLNGGSLQVLGAPVHIATGMRNPFGLAMDGTGNLIVGDNGMDISPLGTDTLYRLAAGQLGGSLFDLGFPDSYTDQTTGQRVNGNPNALQPIASFLPVLSQGILNNSEGLSGMAYAAPGSFPFVGALGGVFITFHGRKNQADAANTHNAVEYYDFASGIYTPIVDSGSTGVGHFDSVLVSGNSLFLADFATNGIEGQGFGATGAIYQFDFSVPEPGTMSLAALGLGLAAMLRRRKRADLQ